MVVHTERSCCLSSCCNDEDQYYKIPVERRKLKKWSSNLNLKISESPKTNFICKSHFEPRYIKDNSLTDEAIPTLYLDNSEEQSENSDYNDVMESFNDSYLDFKTQSSNDGDNFMELKVGKLIFK